MPWPRGKRRSDAGEDEARVMLAELRRQIDRNRQAGASVRHTARWLGVSDRTLRRWLTGEDLPPANIIAGLRQVLLVPPMPPITASHDRRSWDAIRADFGRSMAAAAREDRQTAADRADRQYHGTD